MGWIANSQELKKKIVHKIDVAQPHKPGIEAIGSMYSG